MAGFHLDLILGTLTKIFRKYLNLVKIGQNHSALYKKIYLIVVGDFKSP